MKYSLHTVQEDNKEFHCIYEHETEQLINFYILKEDAMKYYDFLAKGGAFDGFTPKYMLTEFETIHTTDDINGAFETEFNL